MYTSTYTKPKNSVFLKHSPALRLPKLQLEQGLKRHDRDRRLRLRLKNIDNVKWWQNNKHPSRPTAVEIQFTALVTSDEIFSVLPDTSSPIPNYPKTELPSPEAECPELETTDLNCPLQEGDQRSDHDIPHSCVDIYSFDHPRTLENCITQIGQFYASIFPGCRHSDFFHSKEGVMYHIVDEHITPAQKQFVCINCGAEFDRVEEANNHLRFNTQSSELDRKYKEETEETTNYSSLGPELQRHNID